MSAQALPFVPPAPPVPKTDLPGWRLVWTMLRSSISASPEHAFDATFVRRKVFGMEGVLVNDPDGIKHVLTTNASNYRRPYAVTRLARPLGGAGLFLAEGQAWRRQRRLMAPTFTPGGINVLLPHFQEAGLHLLRTIEKAAQVNLSQAFQDTALEAVLRALFSMPESRERLKLGRMARSYVEGPGRPTLFDGFAKSETAFASFSRKREQFQRNWFGAIGEIIAARKAAPHQGGQRDLLDMLIGLKDAETGETLDASEIRDQCGTMFFAGSETTARMMFWVAYLLAHNPEEQARVRAEIAAFPPERVGQLDQLQNWPRLRNVMLEAMRLYPPLPHVQRDAIGPDEICGQKIEAGAQIWISPWVMHRHRKYWDQPTGFLPDRFAGKIAPWTQMPAYMPFGAGPRICIGLTFAMSEAEIVLAHLLARYRISLAGAKPVLPVGRLTIEPSYEPGFTLEEA